MVSIPSQVEDIGKSAWRGIDKKSTTGYLAAMRETFFSESFQVAFFIGLFNTLP